LAARDKRSLLRKQFALQGLPSLSLCLNVPGYPKSNEYAKAFFRYCLRELRYHCKSHRILLDDPGVEHTDEAGDFFIVSFSCGMLSIPEIKQICEDFEEKIPLGRFVDVDLTDKEGNPVSSGKAKLCFFCSQRSAVECRRENSHDVNELRGFMFSKMEKSCSQQREREICRQLSSLALKAILYEISLTPKPGLVDKFNNGSHTDMNFKTFIDSSVAISAYFVDLVHEGFVFHGRDLAKALPVVRNIGLKMESAMFASTHHVNTQKGIIFLMGLSLFACGYLFAGKGRFDIESFREIIRQICKDLTRKELENQSKSEKTHGEEMYGRYLVSGARGEAESGFPMVFDFGLPALLNHQELNDEAMTRAFLSIAAHNDDTNILYRGNLNLLEKFKSLSFSALSNYNTINYSIVNDYCKKENISPGGSADLLAISIFIYLVIKQSDEPGLLNFTETNR
jgi:holo-ACP synthase / triphosphoribosyl-dephospho-CoA synthase